MHTKRIGWKIRPRPKTVILIITIIQTIQDPAAGAQVESNQTVFQLKTSDCTKDSLNSFSALKGLVTGLLEDTKGTYLYCRVRISVPEHLYVIARFQPSQDTQLGLLSVNVYIIVNGRHVRAGHHVYSLPFLFSLPSNQIEFRFEPQSKFVLHHFNITFWAAKDRLHGLETVKSATGGCIISPAYDGETVTVGSSNDSLTLMVPQKYTMMLSFEVFDIGMDSSHSSVPECDCYLGFSYKNTAGLDLELWKVCENQYIAPSLHNTSLTLRYVKTASCAALGFKMRYSLHPWFNVPEMLLNGLFNCSGSRYASLKDHVHCNMRQECHDREDEGGHCPFSSPPCEGAVAVGDSKCFTISQDKVNFWKTAKKECESRDMILVTLKTKQEREIFLRFFKSSRRLSLVYVGLTSYQRGMPHYYRHAYRWEDNTINYDVNVAPMYESVHQVCASFNAAFSTWTINTHVCKDYLRRAYFVCEFDQRKTGFDQRQFISISRSHTDLIFPSTSVYLFHCPSQHLTYEFLNCHAQTLCGTLISKLVCWVLSSADMLLADNTTDARLAIETFQCSKPNERISYIFVCDFKKDCVDSTDEEFCVHTRDCPQFTCASGQCLIEQQQCDKHPDCIDGDDELACNMFAYVFFPRSSIIPPPAVVNYHGDGRVTYRPMKESDPCPDTHFRCPGKPVYCLPVYLLCNGVYDCLGREDEANCGSTMRCPGFYRCWNSTVCVHPDHVCDGWTQCPRRDDELVCNVSCPSGCNCYGMIFVCSQPFSAQDFPDLRYLDAGNSEMKLNDLDSSLYLIFLDLSQCRINNISAVQLPNLRTLNLGDNLLTSISMDVFLSLPNLLILHLAGNPLVKLSDANSSSQAGRLEIVDISCTRLTMFTGSVLVRFPQIKHVNLSFSPLKTISGAGFQPLPELSSVDLRGCPVDDYNSDLFKGLSKLQFIWTNNFRLCCNAFVPVQFQDTARCLHKPDDLSSCEHLLRSSSHHLFTWFISAMSVTGNIGSIIFTFVRNSAVLDVELNIFVTSLCLSDLLMGVYLAIIGSADAVYRGKYVLSEQTWISSIACRTAGVLCFLSNEVSAFILCLMTLDRFIVLRFPSSTVRFTRKTAIAACALVWTAGLFY